MFHNRMQSRKAVHPLSNEQLQHFAPSIFAEAKHESRSDRYTYIPTIDILEQLRKENFMPFQAMQTRVRDADKRDHTKHLIRLRHMDHITNSDSNEIILINSHDGSSSYQMMGGMYRMVCSNGLVIGKTLSDVRVPHKGDVIGQVIEGAYTVLNDFEAIDESKDLMQSILLDRGEQSILAEQALNMRYEEGKSPITIEQALRPNRYEDAKADLWTTFNILQENLVKGGQSGRTARGGRRTTRAVTGIDQNVKLNRALWALSEKMAELKG